MRFVVLSQYYEPEIGAPQVRLAALVDQLRRRGHAVEVVTALPNYPTGRIADGYRRTLALKETVDGTPVVRVWMYASLGRGWKRLLGYLSFTLTSSVALTRTGRPDWVIVESPPLTLTIPALIYARITGAQSIMNVADLWPDAVVDLGAMTSGSLGVRILRRLEKWSYRNATVVNSVTVGITAILEARTDAEKIRFLPNGVDIELFEPNAGRPELLSRLGLPTKKLFVYTGNIGHSQGLGSVIRGVAIAAQRDPEIMLAFVGDGSARPELEVLSRQLAPNNVIFVDPVPLEMVASLLPCATAAVVSLADLPTNRDARPSKVFPAMASGTPILFAGASEGLNLVREAGAGLTVPDGDPVKIASAMIELVTEPDRAKAMGQNGRRFAVADYSWEAIVERWLASLPIKS